jgi:hypothetical protein
MNSQLQTAFFVAIVVWSLFWKAYALWRAGRNNQKWWFIGIYLLSTLGIIEIIYLVFFQKGKSKIKLPKRSSKTK